MSIVQKIPDPIKEGRVYGQWVVLAQGPKKGNHWTWTCRCEPCGKIKNVFSHMLTSGRSSSCKSCASKKKKHVMAELKYEEAIGRGEEWARILAGREFARRLRYSAKARGYQLSLSIVAIQQLILSDCHYCGSSPIDPIYLSKSRKNRFVLTNGIDRIDNTLGYIENNVVPCCRTCNLAKHTSTYEDFISWINRLCDFRESKRRVSCL